MPAIEPLENLGDSATYKRPGTLGVDYDPYGEEMAPNARVWRSYVEQTDKMDKEMVDGWNKTLDIILLFAALFSAISTAFVLESSKDLKPDPAKVSAQTLALISQTLLAMSNGSTSASVATDSDGTEFVAETSAIVVNALWFMSLSLSVAVSLIAILAKEWCDGFMSGRIGSMLKQGRIRQQRWDGIERWRMREILYMLPLLMHAALLLFAIGLSIYLWSIDTRVALPVVVTSALAILLYSVTAMLPLFSRFCPFTTTLAKLISESLMAILESPVGKSLIVDIMALQRWILWRINPFKTRLVRWMRKSKQRAADIEKGSTDANVIPSLSSLKVTCMETLNIWVGRFRRRFLTDRTQLLDSQVPMDNVTSSMLAWMITNCEDPKSVDLASQAISGADLRLPREPLWKCDAIRLVRQRLEYCLETLDSGNTGLKQHRLIEETSLFSRSFTFLTSHIPADCHADGLPDPGTIPRMSMYYCRLAEDSDRTPYYDKVDGFGCIVRPFSIIESSLQSPVRHDIVAFELNNFPFDLRNAHWERLNHRRKQHQKQWELLSQYTSNQVKLSPSAVCALVNGITKSYLYKPLEMGFHSPAALVDLLHTTKPLGILEESPPLGQKEREIGLRLTVGIALVIIYLAGKDSPGLDDSDTIWDTHLSQARDAYNALSKSMLRGHDVELLLLVGLLGLLGKPEGTNSSRLTLAGVESIGRALNDLGLQEWQIESSNTPLPLPDPLPRYPLEISNYWVATASEWLDSAYPSFDPILEPPSNAFPTSCVNAILCTGLCFTFPKVIIPPLVNRFSLSQSPELKRRCVVALKDALPPGWARGERAVFKTQFMGSNFADQLIQFMESEPSNREIQLLGFYFFWIATHPIAGGGETETAILRKAFKSPVFLGEDHIYRNQDGMSLLDIWRGRLEDICASDPKIVLDSRVLRELSSFYDSDTGIQPHPAKPSDGERTWNAILDELQMDCKKRFVAQVDAEVGQPVAEGPEQEQSDSAKDV